MQQGDKGANTVNRDRYRLKIIHSVYNGFVIHVEKALPLGRFCKGPFMRDES